MTCSVIVQPEGGYTYAPGSPIVRAHTRGASTLGMAVNQARASREQIVRVDVDEDDVLACDDVGRGLLEIGARRTGRTIEELAAEDGNGKLAALFDRGRVLVEPSPTPTPHPRTLEEYDREERAAERAAELAARDELVSHVVGAAIAAGSPRVEVYFGECDLCGRAPQDEGHAFDCPNAKGPGKR